MAKKKPSLAKLRAIQAETNKASDELKRTTVMLPHSMIIKLEEKRLDHKRAGENVTVSALIREAIGRYLAGDDDGAFGAAADAFMDGMREDKKRGAK